MAEVSGKTGKHVWAFTETNYQASPAYINITTGAQGSIAGLRIAIRAQGSDVRSEIFVPLNDVRQMLDLIMANIPWRA